MKTTTILLFLLSLGQFVSSIHAQGACTTSQGLICAGNFIGYATTTPPLRPTGALCPYSAVGSGVLYSSTYGGGYEDFQTLANGDLGFYDVDAGTQTLYATDSCYVPCSSSNPGITGPIFGCPDPAGAHVAGAKVDWTGQQTAPDGNLMGEQPYFLSGGINPTINCSDNTASVATGPVTFIQVTFHRCTADYPTASIGSYMGEPYPAHCTFGLKQAGDAPPSCACSTIGTAALASCSNGIWSCPAQNSQVTYIITVFGDGGATGDPTAICTAEYQVTDYYTCGNFVSEEKILLSIYCPQ